MAVALPSRQARVPSTLVPSGWTDPLGPTASEGQPSDCIPPPSIVRREENISCSPSDLILGRRFPSTTVSASMALMVVPSARMHAQDGTATPSKGGREGIVWTGVSRCPEAHCTSASFLYYSFVDKVFNINTIKPLTVTCGTI
jgi:hypothetical protein